MSNPPMQSPRVATPISPRRKASTTQIRKSPSNQRVGTPDASTAAPTNQSLYQAPSGTTVTRGTPSSEFILACSYSKLDDLAHQPKGTPALHAASLYGMCQNSGRLTLLTVNAGIKDLHNPAFARCHPTRDIIYVVTESIDKEGLLFAIGICPVSGQMRELSRVPTGGRSACYISIAPSLQHILVVNYWDSTMVAVPMDGDGLFRKDLAPVKSQIPGSNADKTRTAHGNDPHSKHRFNESHAHAVVFDPAFGRMVYIPDLGESCIKQFVYDNSTGKIHYCGRCLTGDYSGPRYVEFHPTLNICYCVNELASTIMVFQFDEFRTLELTKRLDELKDGKEIDEPTLQAMQTVPTIPEAFPRELNTCGRICVDPTGKWVLVSNRGHDSIAVYKISMPENTFGLPGALKLVGYHHTARTPRHFKFSHTGKWLFAANQDSDDVSVFSFDQETGDLSLEHRYPCCSPNFIACKTPAPSRIRNQPWIYAKM